ncbi:hypothetical protein V8E36_001715 [Tilletia maclaganii]
MLHRQIQVLRHYLLSVHESFCTLPFSTVMNTRFLCIHGGHSLSSSPSTNCARSAASAIHRHALWTDPPEDVGAKKTNETFVHNYFRGCAYFFTSFTSDTFPT